MKKFTIVLGDISNPSSVIGRTSKQISLKIYIWTLSANLNPLRYIEHSITIERTFFLSPHETSPK